MRPCLIYDADCEFCRRWAGRIARLVGDRVEVVPYQEAAARFPTIPQADFRRAVHLIEPSGRVSTGAEATFRSLALSKVSRVPLMFYKLIPGAAWGAERTYQFVANHRPAMLKLDRLVFGDSARSQENRR